MAPGGCIPSVTSTDDVLALIRTALDEFDDRPLQVSVRRAVWIAGLVGDPRAAVRLAHELMPSGGDPQANAASFQQPMADSSSWGRLDGPAEDALREYFRNRARTDDTKKPLNPNTSEIFVNFLDVFGFWSERGPHLQGYESPQELEISRKWREIQDRTRYRTFSVRGCSGRLRQCRPPARPGTRVPGSRGRARRRGR